MSDIGKHIIDSPLKLGRCVRCKAYVFAADVAGLRVMADPEPLDADGVRRALVASLDVFRVLSVAGRPHKLQAASVALLGKIGEYQFVAAHGCGVSARDAARVEVVPDPPRSRPVTPGAHRAGSPRRSHPAPAGTSVCSSETTKESPSVAKPATPHLSSGAHPFEFAPCEECGQIVGLSPYVSIKWQGRYMYIRHDECEI